MPTRSDSKKLTITRKELIAALNQDLEQEYQAIITYVTYSQVLKGAKYMVLRGNWKHAHEERTCANPRETDRYLGEYSGGS